MRNIPYTYCFLREDLSQAASIIQAAHANFELGLRLTDEEKPTRTAHMVLLGVSGEKELIRIHEQLKEDGIKSHIFFEPDYDLGYTALATQPLYGKNRNRFKNFQLWTAPVNT